MAAIAGLFGNRGSQFLDHCCRLSLDALKPYGSSVCHSGATDQFALGFSPDRFTDTRGEPQPLVEGGRWLMAADVRLDDRQDLLQRLNLPSGDRLSDAEILFRCWRQWGAAFAEHVSGDYAFAAFDKVDRRLTLCRDPTGQRPLYFVRRPDVVAFASMPSGLSVLLPEQSFNLRQMAEDLLLFPHQTESTVFADIQRVRPGETVTISGSALRRTFWRPQMLPQLDLDDDALIERYRRLLDDAVSVRMTDGTTATHLSSGWDSNAVTATAAKLSALPQSISAFTFAPLAGALGRLPRGRFADETAIAAAAARRYGVRHVIVRDTEPTFEVVRRQGRLCQFPILSPFNAAWWSKIRSDAVAGGATTILTGELGNLTLTAGNLGTLADHVRLGRWRTWWQEARRAARRGDVRWRGILINSFGPRLPHDLRDRLGRAFQKLDEGGGATFLNPEWRPDARTSGERRFRATGNSYEDRWKKLSMEEIGPWRLAAIADGGVAERDPTSDRRLLEFSLRLPADQLFRGGQGRALARAALADRVPSDVLEARGRGLQSADWHLRLSKTEALEMIEEIEGDARVQQLLDLRALRGAVDRWPSGHWNEGLSRITYSMDIPAVLATGLFLADFSRNRPQDKLPRI